MWSGHGQGQRWGRKTVSPSDKERSVEMWQELAYALVAAAFQRGLRCPVALAHGDGDLKPVTVAGPAPPTWDTGGGPVPAPPPSARPRAAGEPGSGTFKPGLERRGEKKAATIDHARGVATKERDPRKENTSLWRTRAAWRMAA